MRDTPDRASIFTRRSLTGPCAYHSPYCLRDGPTRFAACRLPEGHYQLTSTLPLGQGNSFSPKQVVTMDSMNDEGASGEARQVRMCALV